MARQHGRWLGLLLGRKSIVGLITLGLANREIATQLGIELCTVKNHVHHILEKLDLGEARRMAPL
ncbi:LuxR C-terminal-related transcriptional regulator [Mycobacterium sp.]|uniref:LuxR C-terminal-related transcriptional regulator n=1 Tax=Mycobacterium sp. TaxID=1785 RepID=UPI0039C91C5B